MKKSARKIIDLSLEIYRSRVTRHVVEAHESLMKSSHMIHRQLIVLNLSSSLKLLYSVILFECLYGFQ